MSFTTGSQIGKRGQASRSRLRDQTSGVVARLRSSCVSGVVSGLTVKLQLATPEDAVFVSGSLYLVGDIRAAAVKRAGMARSIT